jgi:hypothetical protein
LEPFPIIIIIIISSYRLSAFVDGPFYLLSSTHVLRVVDRLVWTMCGSSDLFAFTTSILRRVRERCEGGER